MSMHKGMLGKKDGVGSAKPDVTLKDYIERKLSTEADYPFCDACNAPGDEDNKMEWPFPTHKPVNQKLKLTFDEWWRKQGFDADHLAAIWKHEFEVCWKQAQENV